MLDWGKPERIIKDLQGLWQEALDQACRVYVHARRDQPFQAPLVLAAKVIKERCDILGVVFGQRD